MSANRPLLLGGIALLLAGSGLYPNAQRHFDLRGEWLARAHRQVVLDPISYPRVSRLLDGPAPLSALYRTDTTHQLVIDFVVGLTDPEIALPILYHADYNDVQLSLAYSVAWVESRFRPAAYSVNSHSIDRGLFQLNSKSFRKLREEDFFDPDTNARHGADHLYYCLTRANGEESTALAIYNAGLFRVRTGTIPESTKVYVGRVLSYKRQLEDRFRYYIVERLETEPITTSNLASASW